MLINMNESADFRIVDGAIEGIRFDSKVKSLKTNKRAVRFDQSAGVIDSMKRMSCVNLSQQLCVLRSRWDIAGAVVEHWNWQLEEAMH